MEFGYLVAFGSALCFGAGSILQDDAAKATPAGDEVGAKSILKVTTRLPYLVGLGLDLVGWVLSLLALQSLPLFAVQAIAASSIGVTVLLAVFLRHQPLPRRQLLLLLALGVGLVALAVSAAPDSPKPVSGAFDAAMWASVGLVAALGVGAMRVHGDRGAALVGAVSGLAYGGTALCARALETDHTLGDLLTDPLTLALVPFGVLGIALFAAALQRGSVTVAMACQYAAETVVPSVIGIAFLGDRARDGMAGVACVGFVVTVLAVVGLTLATPADEPAGAAGVPEPAPS